MLDADGWKQQFDVKNRKNSTQSLEREKSSKETHDGSIGPEKLPELLREGMVRDTPKWMEYPNINARSCTTGAVHATYSYLYGAHTSQRTRTSYILLVIRFITALIRRLYLDPKDVNPLGTSTEQSVESI